MVRLRLSLESPGCAQGRYIVRARGFFLAVLSWATAEGPLPGWGPIGYAPIDPAGNGCFFFPGGRAIPREATHVHAHCVTHDFLSSEDAVAAIPEGFLPSGAQPGGALRFSVLTDLHLSTKLWRISRALKVAESDTVFLTGDAANDGLAPQFEQFLACVCDAAPGKAVFPVPGNHDITHARNCEKGEGASNYAAFQARLLEDAAGKGFTFVHDPGSLAYAVRVGHTAVIGLQCVTDGRKFLFPKGEQLAWLERQLQESMDASWRLILCHAPLLKHNPHRNEGMPYLDRDKQLQAILDRHRNIVFLSGHTHVSPNMLRGNAEWVADGNRLYLDCGSAVETDTSGVQDQLMAPDWKDGCVTELTLSENGAEVCMKSVKTGRCFPRGCYRLGKQPG